MLQQENHGGCVELSVDGAEQSDFSDCVVERLPLDELCELEDEVFGLDDLVELGDEGVIESLSHFQLLPDDLHHVVLLDFCFVEQLSNECFWLLDLLLFVASQDDGALHTFVKIVEKFDAIVVHPYGLDFHLF